MNIETGNLKGETGNRLAVSERTLEAMYAEFIAKAQPGGRVTFLESKRRFMSATGFWVGDGRGNRKLETGNRKLEMGVACCSGFAWEFWRRG